MARLMVILLAFVALAWPAGAQETANCGTPVAIGDGWSLAEPAAVGLDTRELCGIDAFVRQWPEANIHAVVVARHGRLVLERYYRGKDQRYRPASLGVVQFAPDVKHDVRSISKSVTSMLLGIALGQGMFPPLNSPVLDAFSEYPDLRTPERMRIDFRHLLTMSSGLAWDETSKPYTSPDNSWWRLIMSSDPVRYVLEQPVAFSPGTVFNYSSGATTVLGRAVARATGMRLDEYARARLFEPLGIADFEWASLSATGETAAAAGLRLRPRDMAKLGQLMLADGRWGDWRVLPAGWVAESIKPRIDVSSRYRYGYQWWLGKTYAGGEVEWFAGFGLGGQRLFVVPTLDLVVVVNAGLYDGPYARLQGTVPQEILRRAMGSAQKQ